MSKKQMGFTLIEIVMVLVLLGILSAVAVPKYFDLRAQAEQKAAMAVVAEAQARINATFASELLDGKTCSDAVDTAKGAITSTGDTSIAEGYTIKIVAATGSEGAPEYVAAHTEVTKGGNVFKSSDTGNTKIQELVIPACNKVTTTP